ncbi:hypothetical protein [Nocardia vinacea]|uniref:hypothetical protein n=1 Tax=Nocardia vinacea TaxID=96468 RepID=UPI000315C8CA|nr:hypothetical protein [Nocardia vinacea]
MRLEADNRALGERLFQAGGTIDELTDFRIRALARIAAQHDEIQRLRTAAFSNPTVTRLPPPRQQVISPC